MPVFFKGCRASILRRLQAAIRALQIVCSGACLGSSAYHISLWGGILPGLSLALFTSITGLVTSSLFLLSPGCNGVVAQCLSSGLADLMSCGVFAILFLASGTAMVSYGTCEEFKAGLSGLDKWKLPNSMTALLGHQHPSTDPYLPLSYFYIVPDADSQNVDSLPASYWFNGSGFRRSLLHGHRGAEGLAHSRLLLDQTAAACSTWDVIIASGLTCFVLYSVGAVLAVRQLRSGRRLSSEGQLSGAAPSQLANTIAGGGATKCNGPGSGLPCSDVVGCCASELHSFSCRLTADLPQEESATAIITIVRQDSSCKGCTQGCKVAAFCADQQ